jgi:hypothetical protein
LLFFPAAAPDRGLLGHYSPDPALVPGSLVSSEACGGLGADRASATPGAPVHAVSKRDDRDGGRASLDFQGPSRELSFLTLANGRPGLTRLVVTANDVIYELSDLAGSEERTLDLSDSMQQNDRNVLTLQGEGAETTSARVTLATH